MGGGGSKAPSTVPINCTSADNNECRVELFTQDNATGDRVILCGTASTPLHGPLLNGVRSVRINRMECALSLFKTSDFTDAPVVLQASRLGQVWTTAQLMSLGVRQTKAVKTHPVQLGASDLLGLPAGLGLQQNALFAIAGFAVLVFVVMMSSRSDEDKDVARQMRKTRRDALPDSDEPADGQSPRPPPG